MSGNIFPSEEPSDPESQEELENELFNQRLIHNTLIKISKDPTVPSNIRNKLHETIMYANFEQVSEIFTSEGVSHTLLGLNTLESPDFTTTEQNMIVKLVDEQLIDYLKELQDQQIKNEEKEDEISTKLLCESRESLQKIMCTYAKNLIEYQNLLEKVKDYQLETLPKLCKQKETEAKLLFKMNDAKVKLLDHITEIQISTENEVSLEAYKTLLESTREQQVECEIEIRRLKELKMKYKMVDSQEYQDILREYLELKTAIEKYHRMQNLINNIK